MIFLSHRCAPCDHVVGLQIALPEGFEDNLQILLNVICHDPFISHFDLVASFARQLQRQLHRLVQMTQFDQATRLVFNGAVYLIGVVEIVMGILREGELLNSNHYMPDETRYNAAGNHIMKEFVTVDDGEKLEGEVFPLVWSNGRVSK